MNTKRYTLTAGEVYAKGSLWKDFAGEHHSSHEIEFTLSGEFVETLSEDGLGFDTDNRHYINEIKSIIGDRSPDVERPEWA